MAKIKTSGKVALIGLVLGGVFAGKIFYWDKRPQVAKESTQVGKLRLPDAPEASLPGNAPMIPVPSSKQSVNGGTKIVWEIMAWNAQFPLMYANGDVFTTRGSLFDKANLQVEIKRQDDCMKSLADLVKFADEYKNNPQTPGVFVSYMGDGVPGLFAGIVKQLEPLGPDYQPIAFYSMGKSYGEDQFMGPKEWKQNPKAALGRTVATVMRDGDMNIVLKWAGDNGLKVNPDETTYDKDAINFIAANDYVDAGNKYIAGFKDTRKLIVDGKKIAKDTIVDVDAISSWTPVDVNVAMQKGGLITLASTKQYSTQMPNITLTIKKFAYDHRSDIENVISSLAQAGDQVRSYNEAKKFAARVSVKVYGENDASYWYKFYNGVDTIDVQGLKVHLGGSMAFNLSDAANMFGLGKDGIDRYKIVYTTFGDILSKMYPELMPTYPAYNKIMDKSFISTVVSNNSELMDGNALEVKYSDEITSQVSSKAYAIQFQTGSSVIMSESYPVLEEILKSAVVAEGLKLGVYGHTDNVGNEESNQVLSENRALAVKNYLMKRGMSSNRIETAGYGSSKPVADNSTKVGQSKNRRVQIVLGE